MDRKAWENLPTRKAEKKAEEAKQHEENVDYLMDFINMAYQYSPAVPEQNTRRWTTYTEALDQGTVDTSNLLVPAEVVIGKRQVAAGIEETLVAILGEKSHKYVGSGVGTHHLRIESCSFFDEPKFVTRTTVDLTDSTFASRSFRPMGDQISVREASVEYLTDQMVQDFDVHSTLQDVLESVAKANENRDRVNANTFELQAR